VYPHLGPLEGVGDTGLEIMNATCALTFNWQNKYAFIFTDDDDDCAECEAILESLEQIDDDADVFGIDFVKITDPATAKDYNVYHSPALVYFRKKMPVMFDGDLHDEERVLEWLTSQDVFEIRQDIIQGVHKVREPFD
jgi:hypothetical protein